MSADAAPVASSSAVEHGSFSVSGSTSKDDVRAALKAMDEADGAAPESDPIAKAAAELGKKGGKAAAAARAKAAKAAPEPEAVEEKKPAAKAAPEAADEDDASEESEDRRSRAKQRVEEATRRAAEERRARERAERERDEYRQRIERLERGPTEERQPARAAVADDDSEPDLDKILAEHDDYNKGLAAYLAARDDYRDKQREKQAHVERRVEGIKSRVSTFREKVAAAGGAEFLDGLSEDVRSLKPSFSLDEGERPTGRTFIADSLVLHPEHSTEVMRHLSENPREFQRIAALGSPYAVSFEVGKLVARFEGVTAGESPKNERQESKPASKAPAPVRPVTGAPSAAIGEYGPRKGETFDDWNRRTAKR